MSLDAIFFDVDDTLFSTSEFAEKARFASCAAMHRAGLKLEPQVLMDELREVVSEFSSNYDHHFDQLLRRIPKRHYKGVNPAIILAAAVIAYHDTKIRELVPYADAIRLLEDLARLDLVRGIISNGLTIKQAEKLLRLGVYPYLTPTAIYISEQIGINKPNVKLYRRACSDLNLKPSRCVYVGDHPTRDIDPANTLGMITVRLRSGGRHDGAPGQTAARHEVRDYEELRAILVQQYGLPLPTTAGDGGAGAGAATHPAAAAPVPVD
ncbi:MAG: HAD-IA family hydrolase [Planctomycetes bacterium]|nr:HAD-IA family hydrolase [Planctomycetota bacterium]